MRVAFHLKYFQAGRIGGHEVVIRRLTAGLAERPLAQGQRMFALCPPEEREAVAGMCPWDGIVPIRSDDGERRMARALRKLQPDLYLCPMAIVEPLEPACPTAVIIPDLQHETYPEFFAPEVLANRRRSYGEAVRSGDLVLTGSQYARRTILERYPETPPERVVAAYPGVDPAFESHGSSSAPDGLPSDYLLYPANFWPHKNHVRLLGALALVRKSGLAPSLVLTGDPSSGFDRVEPEIERLGLGGQVRFLGRLPMERFVPLLRKARALVFPSLYEGFGLPILEAFHCETPVLCSNVASCPEVAGDAALLVDPHSEEALAGAIRHIWTDSSLRAALVAKGRRRKLDFDWERSLEQIRAALLGVARRPGRSEGPLRAFLRTIGLGSLTS